MIERSPLPCILCEDEHLLVVNKPAGWNTHAPSPYAGEGIYDWLRHREPRWATLAIVHRLDKETSGVLVFGKTPLANRSLTEQFTARQVQKQYLLLTDRVVPTDPWIARSCLVRAGDRYVSRPARGAEGWAETTFRRLGEVGGRLLVEARPATGRTHQIRVHAADAGFAILGDPLYGGTPSHRLHLHAAELTLRHPATGAEQTFAASPHWEEDTALRLREAFVDPTETEVWRAIHGAADGWPGWYVDRLGPYLLSQGEAAPTAAQVEALTRLQTRFGSLGVYHKRRDRRIRESGRQEASARLIAGTAATGELAVRENGLRFLLNFNEGYSVGLFLDQRDNRRRLRTNYIAAGFPVMSAEGSPEVLNLFAYTCGFSVCAARAGARVTSVDLSRKYLEWGRRNFEQNGFDPAAHAFLLGDAFDWLRRLTKQGRQFDAVLVDPPTFSTSKDSGRFQADRDFGRLVHHALPLLRPGGLLFASTNAAQMAPERFLEALDSAVGAAHRKIRQRHYAPQPPDFPITREEPAYLKTAWLRID